MKEIIKNPDLKSEVITIDKDSDITYFISDEKDIDANIKFVVSEGKKLKLTFIDFSSSSINLNVDADLAKASVCEIALASINSEDKNKIFAFNTNHLERDSYSRTKMAGINASKGVLKFLGSSYIKNGAHNSDTRQEGKITNLSKDSKSEVSPSLLIKENDVKASHGAALGAYNQDHLFYLMSRGMTMDESKKLITYGTLLPIIETIDDEKLLSEAKASLEALTL